ncbi:hypothetical protein J6590_042962 [Homalodisca vitripennis]|nr:hypothetical protein J6590_042962 [Homalodisca vitripennis]
MSKRKCKESPGHRTAMLRYRIVFVLVRDWTCCPTIVCNQQVGPIVVVYCFCMSYHTTNLKRTKQGKHGNLKLKHGSSDTSFERAHLVELNSANRISKGLSNQKWRVVLGTHCEVHYALPFLTGSSYSDACESSSLHIALPHFTSLAVNIYSGLVLAVQYIDRVRSSESSSLHIALPHFTSLAVNIYSGLVLASSTLPSFAILLSSVHRPCKVNTSPLHVSGCKHLLWSGVGVEHSAILRNSARVQYIDRVRSSESSSLHIALPHFTSLAVNIYSGLVLEMSYLRCEDNHCCLGSGDGNDGSDVSRCPRSNPLSRTSSVLVKDRGLAIDQHFLSLGVLGPAIKTGSRCPKETNGL